MSEIKKYFLPEGLEPIYKKFSVIGCIAIQVDQNIKENDFLLEQANKHDFIKEIMVG